MSSGFLPGGIIDASTGHNDEWLAAQQEIEASRRRKAEQSRQAEDKSLYEILQANKGIGPFRQAPPIPPHTP